MKNESKKKSVFMQMHDGERTGEGSFNVALQKLFYLADFSNRRKLVTAFPEFFGDEVPEFRISCNKKKTLNQLRDEIHSNAKEKGFWRKEREMGTLLMLCVSELSEAMEADRKGFDGYACLYDFEHDTKKTNEDFEHLIKDSVEDELADAVIRILDICGAKRIDIEKHIELKMRYNSTREKMHGNKMY